MGNSGSFDTGTGELAPRTGEFLAGVLALSRISRVTVALESGHGAGPALLAAARLTSHAETCLLFDQWRGNPLADLAAALSDRHPELAVGADGNLAQALRALQARGRHSFLIIFDRFDDYLAQPADRPQSAEFDRALVQMANDGELDVHFLLVQDEAAESLLSRYQHAIPGIGDGCLRMPAGGMVDSPDESPAPDAGRASRRDRSFGMLLERLTAIAPADEAAQSQPRDSSPALEAPSADARQQPDHIASDQEARPVFDDMPVNEVRPVFDDIAANEAHPVFDDTSVNEASPAKPEPAIAVSGSSIPPLQAAGMGAPPAIAPTPARGNVLPPPPARRGKALAALMATVLAVGAGIYAYRQQPPAATPDNPAASRQAAEPAAGPMAAATPSGASTEPAPSGAAPGSRTAPASALAADSSAPPAPSVTPVTPATPAARVTAAGADAASPAVARAEPTVYVHVRSQRERDRLQSLSRTLAKQGIRVVDVKVMNTGPSVADLRYFHDEDRDTALTVQKAMVSAGVPVPKLRRMNGYEGSTRPGHFEAWLGGDKASEAVRRR